MKRNFAVNNSGITVGIPFYRGSNTEQFQEAVDSILTQTLLPERIHLIQDGSISSELYNLVESYVRENDNIQLLRIPQNKGLPYALNYSILHTTTPYYARMDADDIAHHERFEKQLIFLEKHPEVEILGTSAWEFKKDPSNEDCFLRRMPPDRSRIEAFFHYRSPLVHSSVIFRRSVFARIGLYNVHFRTQQDIELWARALRENVVINNLTEPLQYFRTGETVSRSSEKDNFIRQLKARYKYNTWSPHLNALKVSTLVFRLMPFFIKEWGYRRLR